MVGGSARLDNLPAGPRISAKQQAGNGADRGKVEF